MTYYSIAAEKQYEAGCILTSLHNNAKEIGRSTYYDEAIRYAICKADPMFWAENTATLVNDTAKSIDLNTVDINLALTTIPSAFCWFDKPVLDSGPNKNIDRFDTRPIVAIAWHWMTSIPQSEGVEWRFVSEEENKKFPKALFIQAFTNKDYPRPTITAILPENKHNYLNDVQLNNYNKQLIRFVIAANSFIRQRLLSIEERIVERHVRKRIGQKNNPQTVKIVHLRASQSSHPRRENDQPVDWSCRWFVRGHWRNQFYKTGTRPRFILPYLKGPEDKPIKAPEADIIYAGTR